MLSKMARTVSATLMSHPGLALGLIALDKEKRTPVPVDQDGRPVIAPRRVRLPLHHTAYSLRVRHLRKAGPIGRDHVDIFVVAIVVPRK